MVLNIYNSVINNKFNNGKLKFIKDIGAYESL